MMPLRFPAHILDSSSVEDCGKVVLLLHSGGKQGAKYKLVGDGQVVLDFLSQM